MKGFFPAVRTTLRIPLAALAALALPAAALADHDGEMMGTFRDRLEYQLAAGYTEELHEDSPTGAVGLQGGVNYNWCPRVQFGLAGGYYWLGNTDFINDQGLKENSTLAVIPIFAQGIYQFPTTTTTHFYVAAGGGTYTKRITGSQGCHCTDWGLNFGGGLYWRDDPQKVGYGLESRFHFLPRYEEEGSQFLSVLASVYIP